MTLKEIKAKTTPGRCSLMDEWASATIHNLIAIIEELREYAALPNDDRLPSDYEVPDKIIARGLEPLK